MKRQCKAVRLKGTKFFENGKEREGICAFLCMITQDKKDILSALKTQELDIYIHICYYYKESIFIYIFLFIYVNVSSGAGFLIPQTTKRNYKKKIPPPQFFLPSFLLSHPRIHYTLNPRFSSLHPSHKTICKGIAYATVRVSGSTYVRLN